VRRLRTAATNVPIIHPPGDIWAWRTMVEWYRQGKAPDLSTELSGSPTRRVIWEQVEETDGVRILHIQYLKYLKGYLTCRKILRHGASGFTSHPKMRIFIALQNPSPRPGLKLRAFGPAASTITTTTPRLIFLKFKVNFFLLHISIVTQRFHCWNITNTCNWFRISELIVALNTDKTKNVYPEHFSLNVVGVLT
jgi:hypothetical protein